MKLLPLPAFADNYIWMLHDGQEAWVVDPGDAQPVLQALQDEGVRLAGILVTHHHQDHQGGVARLRAQFETPVYGPALEPITAPYQALHGGEHLRVLGLDFEVLAVPGHTAHHLAYYCAQAGSSPLLFCGDTLFSAGCGRLFEGTAQQMQASLQRLAQLSVHTRVCCAHEYTLSNLRFAAEVEPGNAAIAAYRTHCQALRAQGLPTLPSTIGLELQINPFLRWQEPEVSASARIFDPALTAHAGVFATLRQWKNVYT